MRTSPLPRRWLRQRRTPNRSSSLPTTIPIGTTSDCAICAVLSLANNFLFATPPLLELPQAVELLHLTTGAEFAHLELAASARSSPALLPSPDID